MFKMPWPPSLRGVLLNDDDSFTTFSRFFFFSINFWGLCQFGSLKTSNASKFPGIEFWGADWRTQGKKEKEKFDLFCLPPP